METVDQFSAGGIAYRTNEANIEIAIILTSAEGRWQLPKGIIDPGETAEQAAIREVREEAGIVCKLLEPIDTIEYWFHGNFDGTNKRYHKKVQFFLMKYLSGNVADHDHEVTEARWIKIPDAIRLLAFKSEIEVVEKAVEMISAINT
ncbi:MAG TPA: NUDIX hydrolase [Pyrinomonadaceae bacterium]|nr:NUDIX hydrolase [Pyrinomonadaceae bacterium]